ncbi:Arylsulfatase [Planctomycetes bacterium Poly30]|uniref:Arylsulfatase n=1 Tax=Saltatorellus ferox TaxID=2528018 RepID=A0A518EMM5_9BACT|nr:Arylsulfatase [Planctomycetes bacterium Poly30]
MLDRNRRGGWRTRVGALALACSGCGGDAAPGGSRPGDFAEPTPASVEGATEANMARTEIDFPDGAVPEAAVPGRPNVLIVTIDTLRADHLEVYGYPRVTSPRLTELAEASVVFEQAYAPMATTLPSHTSMFTGVYPHEHGVLANISDGRTYQRREDLMTLAQLFERAGYETEAVVAAFPLDPQFGLNAGFRSYSAPESKQRPAKANTDEALAALERLAASTKPGFLWVHYFDPHGPYNPPYRFEVQFRMDDEIRAYLAERRFSERSQRPTGQWNELEEGIDRYDGEIAYTDFQIQRLLKAAEKNGWLDGAVLAVLADHGEGLNQHDVPGHGLTWEEQLHVPLMLRIPGVAPRRIPWPVSLVDLAPTLLHVLDVPGKQEFLAQVTGVDRFRTDIVHGDARILGQSSPRQSEGGEIRYVLRADRWKLHLDEEGVTSLYDLDADPFELHDVAGDHGRVVEKLASELEALLKLQRREVRTLEASEQVEAELRALGYGGK